MSGAHFIDTSICMVDGTTASSISQSKSLATFHFPQGHWLFKKFSETAIVTPVYITRILDSTGELSKISPLSCGLQLLTAEYRF